MEPIGNRDIRIGFVGAGSMALQHMKQLAELGGVSFRAHCDVDGSRAAAAAARFGGEVCADYRKLLERDDLDAVYVCVPPSAHGDIELDAVRRELPMFVEKPVNLDLAKARDIAAKIEKAGILTCVGYSLRYTAGALQAERILRGRLDEVGQALAVRWGGMPKTPWWRRMEESGGQLVEQATHQVDLLRGLLGDAVEVQAVYSYRLLDAQDADVPGSQCVLLTFACGAIGVVTCSCAMKAGGLGMIEFMLLGGRLAWKADGCSATPPEAFRIPDVRVEVPKNIDEVFLRALREGNPSLVARTSYAEAVKTLAITLAANVSAAEGRPVRPEWI